MKMVIKTSIITSVLAWLVACSSGPYPITSPYYQIPVGAKIVVHKTLIIPAHRASVYLQGGRVVTGKPVQYEAHCWLRSWEVLAREQMIKPDVFTVTASQFYDDYVNKKSNIRLAAKGGILGLHSGDVPSAMEKITTLKIHSDKQPNIREFSCGYWDTSLDGDHLTVAQIQAALGSSVELKISP